MVARSVPERPWLFALTAAQIGAAFLYAPRLPTRVASHFGPTGAPNGWSSREGLVIGLILLALLMLAVFLGTADLTRWTKDEWVNLPHKAHWLAPERREATMHRIGRHILRMGVATQTLLLVSTWQVLAANTGGGEGPNLAAGFGIVLAGYFVVVAWLLVAMWREFAFPPVT